MKKFYRRPEASEGNPPVLEGLQWRDDEPHTIEEFRVHKEATDHGYRVEDGCYIVWPEAGCAVVRPAYFMAKNYMETVPVEVYEKIVQEKGDGCKAEGAPTLPATNLTEVLNERGKRYGKFEGHARITTELKQVMWAGGKWTKLAPDQREALDMIVHKIGRILNGDPNYSDSWTDIAGYAQLVADRLNGVSR